MYRVLIVLILGMTCAARLAVGADFPTWVHGKAPPRSKSIPIARPLISKLKERGTIVQPSAAISDKLVTPTKLATPVLPETTFTNLTWVLDPLVANADGGKNEGSASVMGNIVVEKPGTICDPELVIELQGHIVKTVDSTVRLDIKVGQVQRSVVWNADEIKAGTFDITIKEKVSNCVLGEYIPAFALVFVTKKGDGRAAMISLEKIVLRQSDSRLAGAQ